MDQYPETNSWLKPVEASLDMSKRVCIVTGAAGFIGSHLADLLLESGWDVLALDNLSLGRTENLRSARQNSRFRFGIVDINDTEACQRILQPYGANAIEMIWHLAANSDIGAGVANPEVDLQNTFLSTFRLLGLAKQFGIPSFAFASSSAIYGVHHQPLTEDTGPLFPISNYGAMKLASEAAISAALETCLERAWIFRFPNVIGPRATHGVIYDFIHKLRKNPKELLVLGDGRQEKPYLHVTELVEAMLFIVSHTQQKLNYFNIAPPDSTTSVRQIAETVVSVVAPDAVVCYGGGEKGWAGDVPKFSYNIDKLLSLGWHPRLSSADAVQQAVREIAQEIS